MDMYGISNAVMEANSLHGQIALHSQLASEKYEMAVKTFNDRIKEQKLNDTQSNNIKDAEDLGSLNSAYQVGRGIYGGVKGGVKGAGEAYSLIRSGGAGAAATRDASGALSAASQSSFLAESARAGAGVAEGGSIMSSLASGARGAAAGVAVAAAQDGSYAERAGAVVQAAGEALSSGVDTARAGLSVAQGAATGFKAGLSSVGGAAAGFGGELSGLEGIAQKTISTLGGGKELGFIAGKAAGAAGGLLAGGEQLDSFIETGGKSAFTRVNAVGQRVAMSGVDKASEFLNEAGAVGDILAASTGGLLVPIAAAVNLAGAVTGIIGNYMDEKSDDKAVGINADGTTDSSKAPKFAAQPISEAFTGLGFVANMSHNPLQHIS